MTLFRRFSLMALLLLSACGFSPIYGAHDGNKTPVSEALSAVYIENIPNENGQKLRNKLMDRLYYHGRPVDPEARLLVSLNASESDLGIRKDATAELSELSAQANFRLFDRSGKELLKGSARSSVIYSKLDAQFGTLAAQRNSYDRAINEIAEQILSQLSLFYAETPPEKAPEPAVAPAAEKTKSWSLGGARP